MKSSYDFEMWKAEFYAHAGEGLKVAEPYLRHLFTQGWSPQQGVERVMDIMQTQRSK